MTEVNVEALQRRLAELAEENVALLEQLENNQLRNLKGWAIDRALETLKHRPAEITSDTIITCAKAYITYVERDEKAVH